VRASATEQSAVTDAVSLIPEGKNVGLVLNQVDPDSSDVQFYGYGRYGHYGVAATAAEAKEA
jgi:hypothetical protein